jgi:GGDEF domain-containing protein
MPEEGTHTLKKVAVNGLRSWYGAAATALLNGSSMLVTPDKRILWANKADKALYAAERLGRNRVHRMILRG